MTKWNIEDIEQLNSEELLFILQSYESEILEHKRQLKNIKYRLKKLSE